MEYIWAAYDVLQVKVGGKWVDVCTIRTSEDAKCALDIVETNGASSEFTGTFQISRFEVGYGLRCVYDKQ